MNLIDFMKLDITESNIDDFGRFSALKGKVNRDIAKAYIEQKEKIELTDFDMELALDEYLRKFILNDGNF